MYTAFMVAAKRSDGTMPQLCKLAHDRIFFARDQAEQLRYDLDKEYGKSIFGVFEIAVDVVCECE